ncbi:MAG: mannose-1-phosphate guanylyltransferase/mannose-6-phosphate isomerase, partial [Gammaproteobacteria bacterium]|nr:mannose-1-phosphate guanylyltransferase/mannose-6-phosphate isomerase [Gammaproteobacteria bacterium]
MKNALQPVILAGGSGTRLWPLSREGYPKQFLILDGNTSLLQQTAQRVAALASTGAAVQPPLVVGGEEHRFLIVDQLREIRCEPAHVILEPLGRNTAPAITLAALHASAAGEDPVLVVTPADQTVRD